MTDNGYEDFSRSQMRSGFRRNVEKFGRRVDSLVGKVIRVTTRTVSDSEAQ